MLTLLAHSTSKFQLRVPSAAVFADVNLSNLKIFDVWHVSRCRCLQRLDLLLSVESFFAVASQLLLNIITCTTAGDNRYVAESVFFASDCLVALHITLLRSILSFIPVDWNKKEFKQFIRRHRQQFKALALCTRITDTFCCTVFLRCNC